MIEKPAPSSPAPRIPLAHAKEIRALAHDLSNALEIIVQTSYLLGMTPMTGPAADWHRLLEQGVQKALDRNVELRNYIKTNTQG